MKKNILLVELFCIVIMMNVSCGNVVNIDNKKSDIQNIAYGDFDVIEQKKITQRLSELSAEMTIDEVTKLWGQEPEVVTESGNNIYKFYCGDINITLWGYKIFRAKVEFGGYNYYVDLEPELVVSPELLHK